MSEAPRDFIRQIIHDDLESGKHDEIVTRFPPEPKAICTSATSCPYA